MKLVLSILPSNQYKHYTTTMTDPIIFVLFGIFAALLFAELEIQIEGKDGWAAKLPTWRYTPSNRLLQSIINGKPLTGYHVYLWALLLTLLHSVFLFQNWSIKIELQLLSFYFLFLTVEDFLWFVLNPNYGLRAFRRDKVTWHTHWFLGMPVEYFLGTALCAGFYIGASLIN